MRACGWRGLALVAAALATTAGSGCKSLNERYIALEVWKYEKCFGHLPPGFTPPGAQAAAAPPPRVCGQNAGCQPACPPADMGCNECGPGGHAVMDGGVPVAGPMSGPAAVPAPAGVTAGKPVVISDELVVP